LFICTWTVNDTKEVLTRSSHGLESAQNEANFNQQQQLLLDISSACSLYMLHGIVTISSEEA
jgi:hypothetical protein